MCMDVVRSVSTVVMAIPEGSMWAYGEVGKAAGIGPRQAGRVVALLDASAPWWRVVHADGGRHSVITARLARYSKRRVSRSEVTASTWPRCARTSSLILMTAFDRVRQALIQPRQLAGRGGSP